MATKRLDHLATYLNDHLAGAQAAIELIDHLKREHAGAPVADVLAKVGPEIAEDRQTLADLIQRVGAREAATRRAAGWLSERMLRLKLAVDDSPGGRFRIFQSLEVLSLGIEGKKALWSALQRAAGRWSLLQGLDYPRLMVRADTQRALVEAARLDVSIEALQGDDDGEHL